MAYAERRFQNPFGFTVTPWVKRLLIINAAVFFITAIVASFDRGLGDQLVDLLAFRPSRMLLEPWTPVTYMFAHGGIWHLLFNMLILFFFGPPLEERWGSAEFIKFYIIAGIGGAALSLPFWSVPIIGASGAIYGVMFAYAYYWPDNPVYIWGILPVKAKWLVGFLIGISIFYLMTGTAQGVAHLAHLGGAAAAFGYLKSSWGPSPFGPRPKKTRPRHGFSRSASSRRTQKKTASLRAASRELSRKETTMEERELLDEVDRILDKISRQGLESLSDRERRQLEEVSRKYRTD